MTKCPNFWHRIVNLFPMVLIALPLSLLTACQEEDPTASQGEDLTASQEEEPSSDDLELQDDPLPGSSVQIQSTAFTVQPGEEREVCEVIMLPTETDIQVTRFQMETGAGTHHLLLMLVEDADVEASIFDCQQGQMVPGYQPIIGTASSEEDILLPDGVMMKLKAHQTLLVDHHVINPTSTPMQVQSRVQLTVAPPDVEMIPSGIMFVNNWRFYLEPQSTTTTTTVCTLDRTLHLSYLVPHVHELATELSMSYQPPGDAPSQLVLERSGYQDLDSLDLTRAPLQAEKDGALSLTCSWFNGTDAPILYPEEMCMVGILVYPSETAFYCDGTGMYDGS